MLQSYKKGLLVILFLLTNVGCAPHHYAVCRGGQVFLFAEFPDAEQVFFASSADQYHYHPAGLMKKNVWKVAIHSEKEFDYFYIVDGVVTTPECPETIGDDFGSNSCVYSPVCNQ